MVSICTSRSGMEKFVRCKLAFFAHTPFELTWGGREMQISLVSPSMIEFNSDTETEPETARNRAN